ncbi:unnamed protein product, partial [Mesorhabditis belari]
AAKDADKERLVLLLNVQLEQAEQLPLENVSVDELNALEKQLQSSDNQKSLKCNNSSRRSPN